jgi:hypothetical protein
MQEAVADPANKRQRALRAHIRRVRAEAEQAALRQIQLAGSSEWRAAAWFLTNSIRGKYLKTARATRPEVSISVADIASTLAEEGVLPDGHHQNGHHQNGHHQNGHHQNGAIISNGETELTTADISGAVQIHREGIVSHHDDGEGLVSGVPGDDDRRVGER